MLCIFMYMHTWLLQQVLVVTKLIIQIIIRRLSEHPATGIQNSCSASRIGDTHKGTYTYIYICYVYSLTCIHICITIKYNKICIYIICLSWYHESSSARQGAPSKWGICNCFDGVFLLTPSL